MTKEQTIRKYMEKLDLTRTEAEELYNEDCEVNKMSVKQAQSDLTEEQKKVVKNSTKTGTKKPTVYKFDKKNTKRDTEKEELLAEITKNLPKILENIVVLNKNNEISFDFNGQNYGLKLTKHRKKKEAD